MRLDLMFPNMARKREAAGTNDGIRNDRHGRSRGMTATTTTEVTLTCSRCNAVATVPSLTAEEPVEQARELKGWTLLKKCNGGPRQYDLCAQCAAAFGRFTGRQSKG